MSLFVFISFLIYLLYFVKGSNDYFYNPLSRFWQIGLGVITYFICKNFSSKKIDFSAPPIVLNIVTTILLISFFIGGTYEGIIRVVICLQTVIILFIFFTENSNKVFNNKYLRLIGKASYSIYLWHWPILVLVKHLFGESLIAYIFAVSLTFVCSTFSFQFIERILLKKNKRKSRHRLIFTSLFSLLIIYLVKLYYNKAPLFYLGTKREKFSFVKNDLLKGSRCNRLRFEKSNPEDVDFSQCKVINQDRVKSSGTIYLYGDSYSQQFAPAVLKLAKSKGYDFQFFAVSGCPIGMKSDYDRLGTEGICFRYYKKYLKFLSKNVLSKDILIFANSNHYYIDVGGKVKTGKVLEYQKELRMISSAFKRNKIVVLGNIPVLEVDPLKCIQPWGRFYSGCSIPYLINKENTVLRNKISYMVIDGLDENVSFIDFIQMYFSDKTILPDYHGFYNTTHLSTKGASRFLEHSNMVNYIFFK